MKLILFTDGASRGNPGPASYGFTISDEKGKLIYEEGKYIGTETNNIAEYTAVLESFKWISKNIKQPEIKLYADSKLVAEQLSGKWKIKNLGLKPLFYQIKTLEMAFAGVTYSHIPRERNTVADGLANLALDNEILR